MRIILRPEAEHPPLESFLKVTRGAEVRSNHFDVNFNMLREAFEVTGNLRRNKKVKWFAKVT